MKALIVGNRPLGSNVIELAKNKLIIAADAGADQLLKYNIIPERVIGDLDSISDKASTKLEEWTISNKNVQKTDLEKAVDYAFEKGASEIEIIGWSGGRIDHTLAALGLAFNSKIAELIRQHNDANVLVLPGRFIDIHEAIKCVDKFLKTNFEAGRHQQRVKKI